MSGRRKPMAVSEIAEPAIPLSNLRGATPKQVISSVLYSENKRADGLVTRTDKGRFKLHPKRRNRMNIGVSRRESGMP